MTARSLRAPVAKRFWCSSATPGRDSNRVSLSTFEDRAQQRSYRAWHWSLNAGGALARAIGGEPIQPQLRIVPSRPRWPDEPTQRIRLGCISGTRRPYRPPKELMQPVGRDQGLLGPCSVNGRTTQCLPCRSRRRQASSTRLWGATSGDTTDIVPPLEGGATRKAWKARQGEYFSRSLDALKNLLLSRFRTDRRPDAGGNR